jgi:outer membrane protein
MLSTMRACSLLALTLALGLPFSAMAEDHCPPDSSDCVQVGKWQLGLGIGLGSRSNPVVNRSDIPLVLLPEVSYTGERFFIQNLDFGAILWENQTHQLNLLLTASYDQVFFHRWNPGNFVVESFVAPAPVGNEPPPRQQDSLNNSPPSDIPGEDDSPPPPILGLKASYEVSSSPVPQSYIAQEQVLQEQINAQDMERHLTYRIDDLSGLHKRRMAALAGIEYRLSLEDWDLQAQWLQDVSGVHSGQETRLSLTRYYQREKHKLALTLGANWQSDAVIDYYYGIRPSEASLEESIYRGEAGISGLFSVEYRYSLTENWTLRLHTSYRQLAKEIQRSPLINDDKVITGFIGGVYHF